MSLIINGIALKKFIIRPWRKPNVITSRIINMINKINIIMLCIYVSFPPTDIKSVGIKELWIYTERPALLAIILNTLNPTVKPIHNITAKIPS